MSKSNPEEDPLSARYKEGTESHYRDAAYYDHAYKRRREDVYFYGNFAREHGGPVLELGVGTGRVACAIARAGVSVFGVDLMDEMLEKARKRIRALPSVARPRVEVAQGDIRTFRIQRKFPLILSPFNVFMHLYTREDLEQALETVRAHLAPGGRFVFDVLNPNPDALARDPFRTYKGRKFKHPETGVFHRYSEVFRYSAEEQVQRIYMFAEPEDTPDAAWMMEVAHRQFFPVELETLLHYNGFEIEHRWGDFDRNAFDGDSDSQIVVARLRS
jgi:SAM-dependent methyltransferase